MTDRPILFSGPMVLALLSGRKQQTRRVLAPQPFSSGYYEGEIEMLSKPQYDGRMGCRFSALAVGGGGIITDWIETRYAVGDRLWVREAWRTHLSWDQAPPRDVIPTAPIHYEADQRQGKDPNCIGKYRHARFMPRWMSRLTLTVTDVRVQRLQDISEADARAEGISSQPSGRFHCGYDDEGEVTSKSAITAYAWLWERINGAGSWDANPWVMVISFTVQRGNIDVL